MMEGSGTSRAAPDEYVEFWTAGQPVKGEFHCAECGYGVTIVRALPHLPHVRRQLVGANELEPVP